MKIASAKAKIESRRSGRKVRARKKLQGTASRPRLAVHRSNRYLSVQLIDDVTGRTLAAASSRDDGLKFEGSGKTLAAASAVGAKIADLAKAKGIDSVVFDKSWYKYHGRVRALAEAARQSGLKV